MKINLAEYDFTQTAHVGHLGGLVGEAFGREVLMPLLEQIPAEQRLGFFISVFSHPLGLVVGACGQQCTDELLKTLRMIAQRVQAQIGPMPTQDTRH